jgi:Abnormal spindle-like microcephaly-assoc'd, ASPM-SPD-2-Hydin
VPDFGAKPGDCLNLAAHRDDSCHHGRVFLTREEIRLANPYRIGLRHMLRSSSSAIMLHGPARSRVLRVISALLLVVAGASALVWYPSVQRSRADEVTISGSALRNGWDSAETTSALLPGTVKGGSFGELFSTKVNGQVYAQPIVIGSTVIVATENDWVYGLNALTGAVKWSKKLGTPWSAAEECTDLQPSLGVTGTPVYDPTVTGTTPNGAIYMVSEQDLPNVTNSNQHPVFEMNAIDPTTGLELGNFPVQVTGAPTNDPTVPMNPYDQMQRPGLLLLGGSVYAAFGSHCDFQPYHGYVVGMAGANAASPGKQTMWSDESGVTDIQGGIWQSGGGLMSDGPGRIFLASGDGISAPPGPGSKPPTELADSVVQLQVQPDGSLVAKDFFSPTNAPYLDAIDGDFGSGGPVALPFGTAALPHLMLQSGKVDGLFVLNRDKLGGRDQGPHRTDAAVSETGKSLPGQWGHAGTFASTPMLTKANVGASADYVYYVGTGQSNAGAPMRYFKAGLGGSNGITPILTEVAQSAESFGYSSGSPVVTSNGTDRKTGVVWAVDSSSKLGATGTLQAFPLIPPGKCTGAKPCTVSPIWTSAPFDGAGKFTTAATDNGHVYIATRGVTGAGPACPTSSDYCGEVFGFGSPARAPLGGASPVNFGDVPVGTPSSPQSVTITNTSSGPVTVSSVSTSNGDFAVAGPFDYTPSGGSETSASFPQVLQPNDTLTAEGVTLTPSAPGGDGGSLEFNTDSANFPVIGVSLAGAGTQDGLYVSSSSVNFGSVPLGTTTQAQITVTNGESSPVTWTTTNAPAAPFSIPVLPPDGTTIDAGQSIPLTVMYAPTTTSGDSDELSVSADGGATSTSISLNGTGVADQTPTLTASPPSVSFGEVPLDHNVQQTITVTNTGNLPAVVTASGPPGIPFGAPQVVNDGLPLSPGDQVQLPVSFAPSSAGPVSDDYTLTWTDAAGSHQLSVPVTGTGSAPVGVAVPPPGGGWTYNGSARMMGTSLSLTQLTKGQAGSAVYSQPVPSAGLKATIKVRLGGGTGGNGMTFALLDASQEGPRAIGGGGPELGFGGLTGVAVAVDTSKNSATYSPAGYVGIATGASGGVLKFARTANVAGLRSGTHTLGISTSGGTVTVTVDGKQVLSDAVTLPPSVRLALTAATGSEHVDNHVVTGATITSAGHPVPAPGGGWSYNGAATTSGSDTRLTPDQPNLAGAVVYSAPVKAVGLRAVFDVQIGGGSGGDGMTFALLNPDLASVRTLGGLGVQLGLGTSLGVRGLGVALATDGPQSPAGFVGLSVSDNTNGLLFQRKAQGIGVLDAGTHVVAVNVTRDSKLGVVVTVFLDGVQVIQESEPTLTRNVRLAFTAGTGTKTDIHIVRNVAISASG